MSVCAFMWMIKIIRSNLILVLFAVLFGYYVLMSSLPSFYSKYLVNCIGLMRTSHSSLLFIHHHHYLFFFLSHSFSLSHKYCYDQMWRLSLLHNASAVCFNHYHCCAFIFTFHCRQTYQPFSSVPSFAFAILKRQILSHSSCSFFPSSKIWYASIIRKQVDFFRRLSIALEKSTFMIQKSYSIEIRQ